MYRLLQFQANQIEMVLASHDVPSRVFGGLVTPRFVQFQLAPPLGIKVKRIAGLSEEIALSLGARSCRVYRQGGTINVEVPREEARTVKLIPLCRRLSQIPPCTAVLGLDESGTPLLLHMPSPDVAHVLIAGTTGSGKTELLRTMIASLSMHNRLGEVQLVLIDPKGRGLAPFAGLPHLLHPLVSDVGEALSLLRRLVNEMEAYEYDVERMSGKVGPAGEAVPSEAHSVPLLPAIALAIPPGLLLGWLLADRRGRGAGV